MRLRTHALGFDMGCLRGALQCLAIACAIASSGTAMAQVPGAVYVIDSSTDAAVRLDPSQASSGNQTLITEDDLISNPSDIAIGIGALFVSDLTQDGIIRIDLTTHLQSHVPANGPGGPVSFNPNGLAVNSQGHIVIAVGTPFFTILRIDTDTDMIFGATPGISWGAPSDLALGPNDELYVRDGPFIWWVDSVNQQRIAVARVDFGTGFVVDHSTGLLYVAIAGDDDSILEIDPDTYNAAVPTANQVLISDDALFVNPVDVALLPDGDLVVANGSGTADEILLVDGLTGTATVVGTGGDLALPQGVAVPLPEPTLASALGWGLLGLWAFDAKRCARRNRATDAPSRVASNPLT